MTKKILAVPGSLRADSSSHVVLHEFQRLLPAGVEFEIVDNIKDIPAFDGRELEPESVVDFKWKVKNADGIIICTPEYAFGVPGSLKNALDWTVGTGEFVDKPVALITASSQGQYAHESLQHTLGAIAAKLQPETTLLISFIRAKVKDGKIVDEATRDAVASLAEAFVRRVL